MEFTKEELKNEVWKDIPYYEGLYQVSNLGRVKSLKFKKTKLLKPGKKPSGYLYVVLTKEKKQKNYYIHQLVAMVFHNFQPDGTNRIVVDHKRNIRTDNRANQLQLITNRYNNSKDKKGGTSKYTGVSFYKRNSKWRAGIRINGKSKHLGIFDKEYDAHLAYQKKLKSI